MDGTRTDQAETEVKLSVDPDWRMPPLTGIAGVDHEVGIPDADLDAVYLDTPDLRLIRSGITLRHRSDAGGTPDAEHGWTLKLPDSSDGPALTRRELAWPGELEELPAEAAALVRATVRGAALAPVARLRTRRRRLRLVGDDGRVLAEIDDDRVAVLEATVPGSQAGTEVRELEVELTPGGEPDVIDAVASRLADAGATRQEPLPKVVRALGAAAHEPPETGVHTLSQESSLRELVAACIGQAVGTLIRYDPGLRLGGDIENVHKARVATRRLRSHLRTLGPALDQGWVDQTRADLAWVGRILGSVRDADVAIAQIRDQLVSLEPADAVAGAELLRRLAAEREQAYRNLTAVLDSPGYLALLDRLVAAAANPPVQGSAAGPQVRAADVLPSLVRSPWKRLRRAVKGLPANPPDAALHRVRRRAKHLRYACELATPVAGPPARRLARRAERLQEVLGTHQDAVVLGERLRDLAGPAESHEALVAGELLCQVEAVQQQGRADWPGAWRTLRKKGARSWLGKGGRLKTGG